MPEKVEEMIAELEEVNTNIDELQQVVTTLKEYRLDTSEIEEQIEKERQQLLYYNEWLGKVAQNF